MELTKNDLNMTVWVKKTYTDNNRKWYKVDANWKTLWRLAVEISKRLLWKNKSYYNDFWDIWDFVIVENIKNIKVTWNKAEDKVYYKHTWFKWHMKERTFWQMIIKNPEKTLWFAINWMLPKNKLRKQRMKRLKLFPTTSNKYDNLSPEILNINE